MKAHGFGPGAHDDSAAASVKTGEEALAWAVSEGAAERLVGNLRARSRQRRRRRIAAVSAAGAMALVAVVALWRPAAVVTPAVEVTTAVVSEPARRVLADGSVVDLRPGAEIDVDYSGNARRIVLRRGEAHFDVVPDPGRPFTVLADQVEVRAVGTAFLVGRGDQRVEVLVTKGRVAVSKTAEPTTPPTSAAPATPAVQTLAMLDAGYETTIDLSAHAPGPQVTMVSKTEQGARLAWRVPRLEFSATPLREAVAMFNRHGGQQLVLDPALGDLRMSGVLRADDIESLLLLLKNEFGIEAEPRGERELTLRRRGGSK